MKVKSSNLIKSKPPKHQNDLLQQLGRPHVDSFNYFLEDGLSIAVADLYPVKFELNDQRITLSITDARVNAPSLPEDIITTNDSSIYPSECRQRAVTYKGRFSIQLNWEVDAQVYTMDKDLGEIPIMLKSKRCNLHGLSPKGLVEKGEHEEEWGGYFVVKGHERLIRMLLMTRRNYPVAIRRSSWRMRGALFSDSGILIRCVTEDQTSTNNVLHFVTDGTAKFMFSHQKVLYYMPLILVMKALVDYCDSYIFQKLIRGFEDDSYYVDCIQKMLRDLHQENIHNHDECRDYIGSVFRVKFSECPPWYTDREVTDFILQRCVLIHLNSNEAKFECLVFMTQKLYTFAQDRCKNEGVDSVMMQEILLGGHLYLQVIKDKLQMWLRGLKNSLTKRSQHANFVLNDNEVYLAAKQTGTFESAMDNFLATGNISSSNSLGLMQDKGLTIVAENINRMRYMSHFKAVHRGTFFQEMRTTEVRQLLPDAWGFICPVHTPDGAPCGLLNHLTMDCRITSAPKRKLLANIPSILVDLGMIPLTNVSTIDYKEHSVVMLNGEILGHIPDSQALKIVNKLRFYKIDGTDIPDTTEICLVPKKQVTSQYPGLFLFTGPARMMRPLMNLAAKRVELVGTFEQVYLDVCITPEEYYEGVTTHMELTKLAFLSNLAQLIPMPDYNQSPRNMYQCQMGKQTMGTPCHNWNLQAETKLYRLQTPAIPLFQTEHQIKIGLNDFAMGTNAVVAVISYTGYDMEDAMIINKASEDRGFAHGSIYKSEFIELENASYFCRDPELGELCEYLDSDGLPFVGRKVRGEEPFYCFYDSDQTVYHVKRFRGKEECVVDSVRLCGGTNLRSSKIACVTFRVQRNPTVGDKFASRAGQKGICSQKWPMEDLPFTESGLVPDIIFNPHGFPSRMTIAMMIELMAGKSAAVHGLMHDATPFTFSEEDTAIDYFGRLLETAGYDYYGTETMYSGIDGREMPATIFFGIVHYQRLRHMVSDKWQVRSTGPIDLVTRQPLKGRKRGGGVRFGEMERDSLISHGTAFLLQDRLFHCSDKSSALICTKCGTLVGPITEVIKTTDKPNHTETREHCRLCDTGAHVSEIQLPYVMKYFAIEMMSCNINLKFICKTV